MNKVRVRLFALLVVCIILVFSVLGLFYSSLFLHPLKKERRIS